MYSGTFEAKLAVELGTLLFNVGFKELFQSIYNDLGIRVTKNIHGNELTKKISTTSIGRVRNKSNKDVKHQNEKN